MNNKLLITGLVAFLIFITLGFVWKKDRGLKKAASSAEKGIVFIESNWAKAKMDAKNQNKLIFLDAYTTWCGPCKLLKKKTFPDEEAGKLFNENFINVAMDMEKGDGILLAEQYGISAYPTLIILDAEGNIITYTQGYMNPKELIKFGQYGLSKK